MLGGVTNYSDIRLKDIWAPWSHLSYYDQINNRNLGLDIIYIPTEHGGVFIYGTSISF